MDPSQLEVCELICVVLHRYRFAASWRMVRATRRYCRNDRPSSFYIYFAHRTFPIPRALGYAYSSHSFRQTNVYGQSRFHALFAWFLLDRPAQVSPTQAPKRLENSLHSYARGGSLKREHKPQTLSPLSRISPRTLSLRLISN
jgi:hypothetical protein